jgi:glycosyltransferase involved in cell wall biosynthesis
MVGPKNAAGPTHSAWATACSAEFNVVVAPRVAIAHDWLVSYAGSERCVAELLTAFPDAGLLTTIVDPKAVPEPLAAAQPSLLQHVPGAARHHEWLVPLMPAAWRLRRPLDSVDAVISSSHACAKAVRVADGIPHVCYCHTPMRYAWDFESERSRFPAAIRPFARAGMSWFRRWDRGTARRVTAFVANSSAVAERVRSAYGRDAAVVHPPVRTEFFTPNGASERDHFLFVGRLVGYKRPELAIGAIAELPYRLVIVGEGSARAELERQAPPNVDFVGSVDDAALRDLYRSAIALVHTGVEDFGIAMAEAQAAGTPVVARRAGGALDIVEDGVTGRLVDAEDADAWRDALRRVAETDFDRDAIAASAQRFAAARFRRQMQDIVHAELT